jgi:hypothetical protein
MMPVRAISEHAETNAGRKFAFSTRLKAFFIAGKNIS